MSAERPVAITPFGRLHGSREDGLNVFRGVRFARAPLGSLRFEPPADLPVSTDDIDATTNGPIAPQPPARLEPAMGPVNDPQGEDCLTATVWAPADLGSEKVPVLVWFHGGAFTTGSGSLNWYSGASLARRGRIVVVNINSRLGALGYLRLPGVSDGNLGLQDQLAGLRWVQRSVEAFGGDLGRVTIMGQSAGAYAVLAMIVHPSGRQLFQRAILQSGPYALGSTSEATEEAGAALASELGIPAEKAAFQSVPVARLLAASGAVTQARAASSYARPRPAFQPCIDGEVIAAPLLSATEKGAAAWCDVTVGYTREEMSVFSKLNPRTMNLDRAQTVEQFRHLFGDRADAAFKEYVALRRWRNSSDLIADALGDLDFVEPALRLALHQEKAGRPAYVYQFDWQSPHDGFGANHCLELPFLFGNPDAWRDAPMFRGANTHDVRHITDALQTAWLGFVASGSPATPPSPWRTYSATSRWTMRFDRYVSQCIDPAGYDWRAPFAR
jgi:para-nitrobenzyl esterase